jgi:hypothetical protein
MIYWLDNFTLYLPPFFHQDMSSNPISYTNFLTFYADLIKWLWGVICKKMTYDDCWNWCFKYSIDY